MNSFKSRTAYERACKVIPGGVNSPVRAFKSVGGTPRFIREAKGVTVTDIDNNQYMDFVASWGPMLLGHAHEQTVKAITKAAQCGTSYGAPTEQETELAELIIDTVPSIEKVRMVNSGTEATMSAIRLARAYTQREYIIKFEGCYHGHGDSFLIKAGSGALTLSLPDSPGVTCGTASSTLIAQYNNVESVRALFAQYPQKIAAVILEPVPGNMGVIAPKEGFLEQLREITVQEGALLLFDEVMSGFRVAQGGAQERFNVMPDLTTLGKIIGGGLPVGAYGGKKEIMDRLAPQGEVYQAGTLSGNPLAMVAGLVMLRTLRQEGFYAQLEERSLQVEEALREAAEASRQAVVINRVGSMLTLFFSSLPEVMDYATAVQSDTQRYAAFFHELLKEGVYVAPSPFEALFVSAAHTAQDIEKFSRAARRSMERIK